MQGATLSNLDLFLLMARFAIIFLVRALFRVDERTGGRRPRNNGRNRFCEVGLDGHGSLLDPDGTMLASLVGRETGLVTP